MILLLLFYNSSLTTARLIQTRRISHSRAEVYRSTPSAVEQGFLSLSRLPLPRRVQSSLTQNQRSEVDIRDVIRIRKGTLYLGSDVLPGSTQDSNGGYTRRQQNLSTSYPRSPSTTTFFSSADRLRRFYRNMSSIDQLLLGLRERARHSPVGRTSMSAIVHRLQDKPKYVALAVLRSVFDATGLALSKEESELIVRRFGDNR